jgi:platelet-activating factor acetylhydrolase
LADYWPPPQSEDENARKEWGQEGAAPEEEPSKPIFPLMIFSHGLGGSKVRCLHSGGARFIIGHALTLSQTSYSSLCGEFASYGFVVCAVEHRDGSGVRTFVNKEQPISSESDSEDIPESSRQDYVYPPDNPNDTSPSNENGVDWKLRKSQLRMRLAEISEAYKVLKQICRGKGQRIADKNLRRKGGIGASSRGLNGVNWDEWKGRVYLDNVTIFGHSFGAATTVEVLRSSQGFDYIGQGITYDIWAYETTLLYAIISNRINRIPIKRRAGDIRIHRPLVAINSEAFMYWQDNFDAVTDLVNEAKEANVPVWSLTVRGSVHISHSDFSILYPNLCAIFFGMSVNPRRALDLNVGASLEFLRVVRKARARIIDRTMKAEGLLQLDVIENVPEDNKPVEEKHLALKIEVPRQFKAKAFPKFQRTLKRMKIPDVKPSDELWVHLATTSEELRSMGIQ